MPEASCRHITRVAQAGIVKCAIPAASPPPLGPGEVIAILAVWISHFSGRTIDALGVVASAGGCALGHCRPYCQGKHQRGAEDFEFHHAFLHSVAVSEMRRASQQGCRFLSRRAVQMIEMAQCAPHPAVWIHFSVWLRGLGKSGFGGNAPRGPRHKKSRRLDRSRSPGNQEFRER
jgi:hypothetical protein